MPLVTHTQSHTPAYFHTHTPTHKTETHTYKTVSESSVNKQTVESVVCPCFIGGVPTRHHKWDEGFSSLPINTFLFINLLLSIISIAKWKQNLY